MTVKTNRKQKKLKLEPHTFGNFPASRVIAEILSETQDHWSTNKLGAFFEECRYSLKNVSQIEDNITFRYVTSLVYRDKLTILKDMNIPENLKWHSQNVLNAMYKTKMGEVEYHKRFNVDSN